MPNFNTPDVDEAPSGTDDVTPAPRLVAVRKKAERHAPVEVEGLDLPDLPVFEGGESLDEGFTPEEQADLESEMLRFVPGLAEAEQQYQRDQGYVEQMVRKAQLDDSEHRPGHEWLAEPLQDLDVPSAPTVRHTCPVTPCSWFLEAPVLEVPSVAALMGGVSLAALEQAREVEQLLTEHLHTHSVMDWLTALRNAQSALDTPPAPVIRQGYEEGVIPGPARRDPAREAAVRAVDARLGRSGGPVQRAVPGEHDDAIRAEFARKRQQTLSPTTLTPQYRADLEAGVVGIKR